MARLSVWEKYRALAEVAREEAVETVAAKPWIVHHKLDPALLRFGRVNQKALAALQEWEPRRYDFNWEKKHNHARAIDLSLWYDDRLYGLCFATAKHSKLRIKWTLLEGHPDTNHPLRGYVATLMLIALESYAVGIGVPMILIPEALAGAIPTYRELGFDYNSKGQLVKQVE
ncbi:hypothetical protein ABIC11_004395 [Pseudomonas oryzihabitans]